MNKPNTYKRRLSILLIAGLVVSFVTMHVESVEAATSAWNPTLLVNTESFQTVDEGDSTTDVEIRFGGTLNEKLYWNRSPARFEFTDDVHIQGNITGSGTLKVDGSITTEGDITLNQDQTAADTVLTFGSDTTNETVKFLNNEDRFEFSDDLNVTGGFYASGSLIVAGDSKFKADLTINSDQGAADTVLTFGSDSTNETLKFLNNEDRFEVSDDFAATGNITASGLLVIESSGRIKGDIYGSGTIIAHTALKTRGDITLNDDATAADTVITFGSDTNDETMKFLNNEDRFEVSDDFNVTGQLYASGTTILGGDQKVKGDITLNSDQGAADTVLTFGSDSTNETVKFLNNEDRFEFSDDLNVTGGLYASGALIVGGAGSIKGDFTINSDQGVADTILTFGSDTTNETVKFLNNEDRFEFSDDLRTTGNLYSSGTLIVDCAATFKSTIRLNGVTYTFPTSDGSASGKVLKTNSAGQLSWSSDIDTSTATATRNSGSMISLSPDYPGAIYFSSGAATNAVGTLGLRYDSGSTVNYYRWQSTKTTSQNYWIISRVRIPDQFSGWESTKPIEFRYRSSGGWLEVRALDTNNAVISLSSHTKLSNSSWTTATITGPEVSGAFASGSYITLMVKMVSSGAAVTDRAYADASFINLNLETKN